MTIMTPKDFEVLAANAAFLMAASSGNVKMAINMLQHNPDLAEIRVENWMLPIHIAASGGHRQIALLLYRSFIRDKFDKLTPEQRLQIFFTILKNNIFGKASHRLLFHC